MVHINYAKKCFSASIILLCITQSIKAQFLSPKIMSNYSSSVIAKVFEVSTNTAIIQYDKQLILADFFAKKDSLIKALLIERKPISIIRNFVDSINLSFEKLLSKEEIIRYNTKKYQTFLEYDAKADALLANKRYNADTSMQKNLYIMANLKNAYTIKLLSSNIGIINFPDTAYTLYNKYDSLTTGYLIRTKGQPFLNEKIVMLNNIKPLQKNQEDELKKGFNQLSQTKGNNYYKNFITAMRWYIKDEIYYQTLYKDSIKNVALEKAKVELEDYSYEYGLPSIMQSKIFPIIIDKYHQLTTTETMHYNSKFRDSVYQNIKEVSWLKIKKELIRHSYYKGEENRFANVLKLQKILKLTDSQLDTLVQRNYDMELIKFNTKRDYQGAEPDFTSFVNASLKNICREGQYDTLLTLETLPQAKYNTSIVWEQIKKYNLIKQTDSAVNYKNILNYNVDLLKIGERYRFDKKAYDKAFQMLQFSKPTILNKLSIAEEIEGIDNVDKMKN